MQQGRHIAHKFESGWEVGVIKAFDKKGPYAGEKTSTGFCWGSRAVIPFEVTMTVSAGGPIFLFCCFIEVTL